MILKPETNKELFSEMVRHAALHNCDGDLGYCRQAIEGFVSEGNDIDISKTLRWLEDSFICDCEVCNWYTKRFPPAKGFRRDVYNHETGGYVTTRRLELVK